MIEVHSLDYMAFPGHWCIVPDRGLTGRQRTVWTQFGRSFPAMTGVRVLGTPPYKRNARKYGR